MGSPVSPALEQGFASRSRSLVPEAPPDCAVANGDINAGRPDRKNSQIDGDRCNVIGTGFWPPLSESTRPVPRSSSDFSRLAPDPSVSSSQAETRGQDNSHSQSNRTKSRTRAGSSSGSGPPHTFHRPSSPAPPPFPGFDSSHLPSTSMADTPRPGVGNFPRNTIRRGNQNNYGGVRHHQDRRDTNVPPLYMPRPPMGYRPPPPLQPMVPPFMPQPPMGFFPGFETGSPLMYMPPPLLPPESFRPPPMPFPPPPPMLFPPVGGNTLTDRIIKQIEYYFSDDNLAKDTYLRSKMDEHGWVPIRLISSFRRVEQITKDIQAIKDALRHSTVVELQGENIRGVSWAKWVRSIQPKDAQDISGNNNNKD